MLRAPPPSLHHRPGEVIRRRTRRRTWRLVGAAAALVVTVALVGAPPGVAQDGGSADAGEAVYRQHCAMCHGDDASGMMGMHPSLRGAVDRLTAEGVAVTVRKGRSTTPPMPSFEDRLSEAEIDDVIAYVGSLPDGPRNFGPGADGGMGGGMMDGGPGVTGVVVVALVAALAGLVGYVVGTRRRGTAGG